MSHSRNLLIGGLLTAALAFPFAPASVAGHADLTVFPLPDNFRPEGIATIGSTAYVGSLVDGDIYGLDLRTGEGSVVSEGPGTPSVGLHAHDGLLWVAGGPTGTGRVVDPASGEVQASYSFTTAPTFINDVVVTDDAAWFTDSAKAQLYRVSTGRRHRVDAPAVRRLGAGRHDQRQRHRDHARRQRAAGHQLLQRHALPGRPGHRRRDRASTSARPLDQRRRPAAPGPHPVRRAEPAQPDRGAAPRTGRAAAARSRGRSPLRPGQFQVPDDAWRGGARGSTCRTPSSGLSRAPTDVRGGRGSAPAEPGRNDAARATCVARAEGEVALRTGSITAYRSLRPSASKAAAATGSAASAAARSSGTVAVALPLVRRVPAAVGPRGVDLGLAGGAHPALRRQPGDLLHVHLRPGAARAAGAVPLQERHVVEALGAARRSSRSTARRRGPRRSRGSPGPSPSWRSAARPRARWRGAPRARPPTPARRAGRGRRRGRPRRDPKVFAVSDLPEGPLRLGPLLRFVDDTSATIWVETSEAATVVVEAGDVTASARTFRAHDHHYALVEVTGLPPGTATPYRVLVDDQPVWPPDDPEFADFPPSVVPTLEAGEAAARGLRLVPGERVARRGGQREVRHRRAAGVRAAHGGADRPRR